MNKVVKDKWVSALRSGQYTKGRYQSRTIEDRYDAGGVLCDLAVREGVIAAPEKFGRRDGEPLFFGYTYGGLAVGIPPEVESWAGVKYREVWRIAFKGDCGMSFDEIADYIEETL